MEYISIVALIGISFTIFASFYFAPGEEYVDSNGKTQYYELGDNDRFGQSTGFWLLGMLLIGCWFKFAAETYAITIAMILAIIGQIVAWGIVYYIKTESLVISEAYGAIIFVLILWSISIVLVFHNMKGKNKLERKFYSSEGRTQLERKSFSKYVKDEILERQQNRCAMCNNNLFYSHYDHIDGNRSNNSLGNCQALCPNCHDLKTRRDQRNK